MVQQITNTTQLYIGQRRYECPNCSSILTLNNGKDPSTHHCPCNNKYNGTLKEPTHWKLLTTNYTEEEWNRELTEIKSLYSDIMALIDKYMDMNEVNSHLVALWILGTYIYDEFNTYPLLFINAVKGSGKTRLLGIIEALSWNGKIETNLREAVLFRTKKKHTMIIDEFEQVGNKEMGTMRELLNASYKRSSRVERLKEVIKDGKKEYLVEAFDLYSPLALANIWGMDETVKDRCIVVVLDKSDDLKRTRLLEDFNDNPEFKRLKLLLSNKQCSLCSVVSGKKPITTWNAYISQTTLNTLSTETTYTTQTTLIEEKDKEMWEICKKIDKIGIYGRDLELFFPLFLLSSIFGEDHLMKTLIIGKHYFDAKNNEEFSENPDVVLLDFLWNNYQSRGLEHIFMSEIVTSYKLLIGGDDINSKTLGRSLVRLNVILDKKRESKGVKIMLDMVKVHSKLQRYSKK